MFKSRAYRFCIHFSDICQRFWVIFQELGRYKFVTQRKSSINNLRAKLS